MCNTFGVPNEDHAAPRVRSSLATLGCGVQRRWRKPPRRPHSNSAAFATCIDVLRCAR